MTETGRVSSVERDGCGCLIAWEELPNGHRAGLTVEACPKHSKPENFDPADFVEVGPPMSNRAPGRVWSIEANRGSADCPLCFHAASWFEIGYDHLNGSHECGCPLTAPAGSPSPEGQA